MQSLRIIKTVVKAYQHIRKSSLQVILWSQVWHFLIIGACFPVGTLSGFDIKTLACFCFLFFPFPWQLSQSMKQARRRLASFKTVNQKDAPEFPDDIKKSFPTQEVI